jgi:hypothetical protein
MLLLDRLNIPTKREYTDEGFLIVPARISRIGIQEYMASEMGVADRDPMDIIRVYRPESEVFSDVSLSSFSNKPVTNNHPPELVNSKNYRDYAVGFSGSEVKQDGMFAETILRITDEESIKLVESGKVELSNGYTADIDWTPGVTPEGEQYDAVQRNIKGNHIAIVERGRAGASCKVADNLPDLGDRVNMAKITIDGVDFEVSDQAAQAVGKLQADLESAEKEAQTEAEKAKAKEDEMAEKAEEAKKTEDSLKAKLDDATTKIPTTDALDKMVSERTALVDTIRKVAPDMEWEGKDSAALKREAVAANYPTLQIDSLSEDYISARFDLLSETIGSNSQHQLDDAFRKKASSKTTDSDDRPADVVAREKMMADSRDAWKKGNK